MRCFRGSNGSAGASAGRVCVVSVATAFLSGAGLRQRHVEAREPAGDGVLVAALHQTVEHAGEPVRRGREVERQSADSPVRVLAQVGHSLPRLVTLLGDPFALPPAVLRYLDAVSPQHECTASLSFCLARGPAPGPWSGYTQRNPLPG